MSSSPPRASRRFPFLASGFLGVAAGTVVLLTSAGQASAATTAVDLQTAAAFGVLGGSTVTNTGGSVISGDVGVSPGTAITGFPPGVINNGSIHAGDALAAQAQADTTTAYNQAAGEGPVTVEPTDLGGQTLVAGVYDGTPQGGPIQLTGTVTLNAQGDPNAVFVFQTNSTLITAPNSVVALINGASACNVFWQVGSSATLGTGSTFVGTVDALTAISAQTGATIAGRLLARNAAVTLDTNTITIPGCSGTTTTTTTATSSTTTPVTVTHSTTPVTVTHSKTTPVTVTATAVPATAPVPTTVPAGNTTDIATPTTVAPPGGGIPLPGMGLGGGSPPTPLASTGVNATWTAGAGFALVALGGAALAGSKRRRSA